MVFFKFSLGAGVNDGVETVELLQRFGSGNGRQTHGGKVIFSLLLSLLLGFRSRCRFELLLQFRPDIIQNDRLRRFGRMNAVGLEQFCEFK